MRIWLSVALLCLIMAAMISSYAASMLLQGSGGLEEFVGPFPNWACARSAASGTCGAATASYCNAVGDGVADDTAVIQACLTAMGASAPSLWFPAGRYVISTTLHITGQQNLNVIGASPSTTTILWGGNSSTTAASFTGAITNNGTVNTLTLGTAATGTMAIGQALGGAGITTAPYIQTLLTGTMGASGSTYRVSNGSNGVLSIASEAMTTTNRSMLYLDGVAYSRFDRLTFNGQNNAAMIVDQSKADSPSNYFDTANEFTDDVFENAQIGFNCGGLGFGCSEVSMMRDSFLNLSHIGAVTRNFNALDVWIWYSLFSNNGVGAGNTDPLGVGGSGNIHVFDSVFLNSSVADIDIGNTGIMTFYGNYSSGSNQFLKTNGGGNPDNITIEANTILDTTQNASILISDLGPTIAIDNIIRTLAVTPPAKVWSATQINTNLSGGGTATVTNSSGVTNDMKAFTAPSFAAQQQYYFEAIPTGTGVGTGQVAIGLGNTSSGVGTGSYLGQGTDTVAWYGGGNVTNNAATLATAGTFSAGDRLTAAIDRINNKVWFKNLTTAGGWNNDILANQNPATNTGGIAIPAGVTAAAVVAGVNLNHISDSVTGYFTSASWTGTPPSGFGTQIQTGPIINAGGADTFSMGNTFSIGPAACGTFSSVSSSTRCRSTSDQLVARSAINPTQPALPGTPPNNNRAIFEASTFAQITSGITSAAALCNNAVVHIQPGSYSVTSTIVVPANCPMQIIGDGGATNLTWAGSAGGCTCVMQLTGPSKAVLRDFLISAQATSNGIVVTNADQSGSRVYMAQVQTEGSTSDLVVDSLDYTNVELLNFGMPAGGATGINVIGGSSAAGGNWLGGATNVFNGDGGAATTFTLSANGHLTARQIWDDAGAALLGLSNTGGAFGLAGVFGSISGAGVSYSLSSFTGAAAILNTLNNSPSGTVSISGSASGGNVLVDGYVAGTAAPFSDTTSPADTSGFLNNQQVGVGQLTESGSSSSGFLTTALTPLRAAVPTVPGALPAGVTDARLYRVVVGNAITGIHLEH